eukprot:6182578-Pleurochrysis_carterae.AAC.2
MQVSARTLQEERDGDGGVFATTRETARHHKALPCAVALPHVRSPRPLSRPLLALFCPRQSARRSRSRRRMPRFVMVAA